MLNIEEKKDTNGKEVMICKTVIVIYRQNEQSKRRIYVPETLLSFTIT
jgi:hypothetical protein